MKTQPGSEAMTKQTPTTEEMLWYLSRWATGDAFGNDGELGVSWWSTEDKEISATIRAVLEDYPKVKVEVEKLTGECENWEDSFKRVNVALSKAAAELEQAAIINQGFEVEKDALRADLAAARPLLEAAKKSIRIEGHDILDRDSEREIIKKAFAFRKQYWEKQSSGNEGSGG